MKRPAIVLFLVIVGIGTIVGIAYAYEQQYFIAFGAGTDDVNKTDMGKNKIHFTNIVDTIDMGAGDDLIQMNTGNDVIGMNEGNDCIFMSSGADEISLGPGSDKITFNGGYAPPPVPAQSPRNRHDRDYRVQPSGVDVYQVHPR